MTVVETKPRPRAQRYTGFVVYRWHLGRKEYLTCLNRWTTSRTDAAVLRIELAAQIAIEEFAAFEPARR